MTNSPPYRDRPRTFRLLDEMLAKVVAHVEQNPEAVDLPETWGGNKPDEDEIDPLAA